MKDVSSVIQDYQSEIVKIYTYEKLDSLAGVNHSYELGGRNILLWFHQVTNNNEVKRNYASQYFDLLNDLIFCSDEMLYFTAQLYLYRPFINNPLHDSFNFEGTEFFPNNQNIEAKRYNMFADIVSQKAYNYWDRIGDLLASFFPSEIEPHLINFSKTIDCIPSQFRENKHYQWLNDFKEKEYRELNAKRKKIVHYTTTDTDYTRRHLEVRDRDEMKILQEERERIPEYYKTHLGLTLKGFEHTLLLLEEVNTILFDKEDGSNLEIPHPAF